MATNGTRDLLGSEELPNADGCNAYQMIIKFVEAESRSTQPKPSNGRAFSVVLH